MLHTSAHLPRRRSRAIAVAALCTLGLALAACGTSGSSGSPDGGASATPVRGGTITVGIANSAACMDPQQQSGTIEEDAFTRVVVDSLTSQDATSGKIEPWLATSWTVNKDATSYTFDLRSGVTFSDGTPFTATVVKDNLDYIKKTLGAKAFRGASFLTSYVGTEVVDEHTAKVEFSAPSAQFLNGSSTVALGMLAPATMKLTPDQRCQGKIVGTGPYKLTSFTHGSGMTLDRRSGYDWAPSAATHTGAGYLDKIDVKVIPDTNVRAGALKSGQIDLALSLAAQDAAGLSSGRTSIVSGTTTGMSGIAVINTLAPGLEDPEVRKAVRMSVDDASNTKAVLGQYFKPGTSVLTSRTAGYKDESSLMPFDPKQAEALLDKAGWTVGSGGVRQKDGVQLAFTLAYSSEWNGAFQSDLDQLIQQNLKTVGIKVTLSDLPRTQFLSTITGNNPPGLFMLSSTSADPDVLRGIVLAALPDKSAMGATGLTQLFAQEQADADPAQRSTTFGKIQDILVGDGYMLPLYELAQIAGVSSDLHGFRLDHATIPMFYDAWKAS